MNCFICGGENFPGAQLCQRCSAPLQSPMPVESKMSGSASAKVEPSIMDRLFEQKAPSSFSPRPSSKAAAPEAAAPEAAAPEAAAPEAAAPEVAAPEVAAPEVAAPEVAVPEVAVPEVAVPEVAVPEVAVPEVAALEVAAPEVAALEVAAPKIVIQEPPVENWDMDVIEELPAPLPAIRPKVSPILWVLIASAIGAVAGGAYVFFGRPPIAPAQIQTSAAVAPVIQKSRIVRPAIPNTLPTPPQPVAPAANVDPVPLIDSPNLSTRVEPKMAAPIAVTAPPESKHNKFASRAKHLPVAAEKNDAPQPTELKSPQESPASAKAPIDTSGAKPSLTRELDNCHKQGGFAKVMCVEKARWKFCNVNGVWDNSKAGCEVN